MSILDKLKKAKDTTKETAKSTDISVDENAQTSAVTKKLEASEKVNDSRMSRAPALLKSSHISEKAAHGETKGQYTFLVAKHADKESIKNAVEALYGVRPKKVRTIHVQGKDTSFGYRKGRRSDWKKAMVSLPKGKTIHIHEGV